MWHGEEYWPCAADAPLKLRIFENPRLRRPPSGKIKIAISPQGFDRLFTTWRTAANCIQQQMRAVTLRQLM